jgi:ssDNA-binding Zn-finger/Zn-ribbon topoisomerase 1
MGKSAHHRGPHQVTARKVVAAANAMPDYRCPTCHLTLAEGVSRWGKNGTWDAGHREHGRPECGYHAQHAHCNRSEGATYGNARRIEPHSERW